MCSFSLLSHRSRRVAPALVLTAGALIASFNLTGCSKESDQGATNQQKVAQAPETSKEDPILQLELLKKIPSTSVGFLAFDLKGDSYKRFRLSPWGSDSSGMGSLQTILEEVKKAGGDEAQTAILESILGSLKKLGLVSAEGKSQIEQVISNLVFFVDAPPVGNEAGTNVGLFADAAGTSNLKEKLGILEGMLKEAGAPISKETYAGAEGFVIKSPAPPAEEGEETPPADPFGSIFVAASEKRFGFSRSKATVEALFKGDSSDGFAAIKASPEFQKSLASLRSSVPLMSIAYLSVQKLIPAIDKVSKENANPETPAEFNPKEFPVDSVIMGQGMEKQFLTSVAVAMTGRTDNQKTIIAALEGSALPTMASKLPADIAFALSLDTKFLSKLEPLLKSVESEASAEGFKVVKSVQGATVGLRNNDAGSPFPDLFFAIEATNRDELAKLIENVTGQAMSGAGAPSAPWQAKDIAGTPTRFFATPLGVGMYLASPKDSTALLIASSERAVKDAAAAAAGGSPSLNTTLSSDLKQRIDSSKLALVYMNFDQVANVVDSVKSSLAMFTGGASEIDKQIDSAKIRQWGVTATGITFKDGVLKIDSSIEPPSAAVAGK